MGFVGILSYFLLGFSALVLTPYLTSAILPLSKMRDQIEFAARSLTSVICLCICATYGVFASIALRCVGKGGLSQWTVARAFKWTMWFSAGVTFDIVEGEEYLHTRPCVIVGNHQTELDVLMLGIIFPPYCSVTAKSSLKWTPFLGQFMALSKTVFINRANRSSALHSMDGAAQTIRSDRQSVYIFPEGTRSYAAEPMLLPFKKGAFHLAVQAQVPVVPVVVANYNHVLDVKGRVFRRGRIPVKVLRPVETKGMTTEDVNGLAERVRGAMLSELAPLTERARRDAGVRRPVAMAVGSKDEVKKEL